LFHYYEEPVFVDVENGEDYNLEKIQDWGHMIGRSL